MSDKLNTNLNVTPYFDDYDETKEFYRILFKPANAVQTRELNQLQTIIQNQISRFANHIFKNGSIVEKCNITYQPVLEHIFLENSYNTANTNIALDSTLEDYLVVSANTGVRGVIRKAEPGFVLQYPDSNRFYIDYVSTGTDGANNDISLFQSGEEITLYDSNQTKLGILDANNIYNKINILTANATVNSTGQAYAVSITDGIIYQKGHFLLVQPHLALVKKYDTVVDKYVVGFETSESIITSLIDVSLKSNAAGFFNVNAPGADRLKLSPTLVSYPSSNTPDGFFPVVQFDQDSPSEENSDAQYSVLGDQFARRTFEVSGDYVVKPFSVESIADSANTALFSYRVSPGIGYVKGYRVELIGARDVSTTRATTTSEAQAQIVTANYGSYVICDEYVGVFDFDNLDSVSLYDTAQNALSTFGGSSSVASGNIIGSANVRSVRYETNSKGSPTGEFRLYLFNIVMNTGKSFLNDVKSIIGTSAFGTGKADIVLEGTKAKLKDSSKNNLVFSTGISGLRRLRDSTGTNDTQFVFRDILSATLQSNGFVTFTTNSPFAGGLERLNSSAGTLSDVNELQYTITLSNELYGANSTGTVDSTSTTTTLTGTGTAFTTEYEVDDYIRVFDNSSYFIRQITAISSDTSITINSSLSLANNVAKFQPYLPSGSPIDLSGSQGSINVISNTQFSVSTKYPVVDSGVQTVYAQTPILRTSAVQINKTAKKDVWVKIDCSNNVSGTSGPWNLGLIDVYKVSAVYFGTSYANTNPNYLDRFVVDSGQRDSFYDHGTISVLPKWASTITSSSKLLIKLEHFEANTTAGIGFFSVDSYPIIDVGDTANSTNISIGEIPLYKGIDLRNSIDIRALKYSTATSTTTEASATINPPVSNSSFDVSVSGQYMIQPDSNFQADVEYYLGRKDIVSVTKAGDFVIKNGQPDENPQTPFVESDSMPLASVDVPPYPSLTTREAEIQKRNDLKIKSSIISNQRYTQRDIGTIDQRLTRIEYYTVLNTLEQSAKDIVTLDANGLDRFKNGIFADPMNSHAFGKVSDFEYSISIDSKNSVARPLFEKHDVDFTLSTPVSSTVQVTGSKITLPYTPESFISQQYATKFRNATASVWKWNGDVDLFPKYDHFRDETSSANIVVNLDLTAGWDEFAQSEFGVKYGDWRTTSQTTNVSGIRGGTSTSTRTASEREIQNIQVDTMSKDYNLGSYVNDFSINPFMRSRDVAFVATGLKPNTTLHVFFDDVNVDVYCAQGTLSSTYNTTLGTANLETGSASQVVSRTNAFGTTITSDSSGNVYGIFNIPPETFRVGDRRLQITNISDLVTGGDARITSAFATFTASSVTINTQGISLNTSEPTVAVSTTVDSRTIVNTQIRRPTVSDPWEKGGWSDPIGQSFILYSPNDVTTGTYITGIEVYFQSKDPLLGVSLLIMEMDRGLPDSSKIVSTSHLTASQVSVSSDASVPTLFTLPNLPHLTNDAFYMFVIKPDSNSPEYNIWISEIGNNDVISGNQIYSNPYIGNLYQSSNMSSWTAIQTEDIKFNIYRAKFTVGSGTASFENEDDEYFEVDGITLANSSVSVRVGDHVYSQFANTDLDTGSTSPFGIVQFIDQGNNLVHLDHSINGGFSNNDIIEIHRPDDTTTIVGIGPSTLISTSTITEVKNLTYNSVVPRFASIQPALTSISYGFKGTDSVFNKDGSFIKVTGETEKEFLDKPRFAMSKSNELVSASGNKSSNFDLTLTTSNAYTSPQVDMIRKSSLFIENIINDDNTNEHTRYGNALTKYVSRNIILAEGQDAEDLNVYVGAFRPGNTNIDVYVKIQNGEDPDPFDDKIWTKLDIISGEFVFSNTFDTQDYREYQYGFPSVVGASYTAFLNSGNSNIVEYTSSSGSRYTGFKTYSFKIVLRSTSSAVVPHINDIRSLALQV